MNKHVETQLKTEKWNKRLCRYIYKTNNVHVPNMLYFYTRNYFLEVTS